jgi:hypothetical protein
LEEPDLLAQKKKLVTVGETECYSVTQKQIVKFENSLNINSILISFFCVVETICYEFVTLKLAVNKLLSFKFGTYTATSLLKKTNSVVRHMP